MTHVLFDLPPHSLDAEEFARSGQQFEPDLHLTGTNTLPELFLVRRLLERYGAGVVAYRACSGFDGTFGLELQFGRDDEAVTHLENCSKEYEQCHDANGAWNGSLNEECIAAFPIFEWHPFERAFSYVHCRVGRPAEYLHAEFDDATRLIDIIRERLNASQLGDQAFPLDKRLAIIHSKDDYVSRRPYNRFGVCGDFVITRVDRKGNVRSLSLEEARMAAQYANASDAFSRRWIK